MVAFRSDFTTFVGMRVDAVGNSKDRIGERSETGSTTVSHVAPFGKLVLRYEVRLGSRDVLAAKRKFD
jgi:hypothetical protein